MLTVTIDNILALRPCYTRERLESLFGDRIEVTPRDIAAASIVSVEDRAWVLLRLAPRGVWMPAVYRAAERAIRHACWALDAAGLGEAAEALACGAPPVVDAASAGAACAAGAAAGAAAWAAARAARDAAGAAAGAAAWAAARAARDAAGAAAWAAARDAAWAAAWAAARAAAWDAAGDAAGDAEMHLFLDDVASLLER